MTANRSQEELVVRLALAVKRLRTRLRESWPSAAQSLSTTQLAILKRLRDDGPATAAMLAVAEHVSQQAIAQQIAALRESRLVTTRRDPDDRRKSLVRMTKRGLRLFDSVAESRNAWLMRAIASEVPAKERASLVKTIELLERLASADTAAD